MGICGTKLPDGTICNEETKEKSNVIWNDMCEDCLHAWEAEFDEGYLHQVELHMKDWDQQTDTAIEKLYKTSPEAAKEIDRIIDCVFTPNELWRQENYSGKFFAEMADRVEGMTRFVKNQLREHYDLDGSIHDIKEVCDL